MAKFESLLGQRFGRLTVTSHVGVRHGKHHWACTCDCGGSATVPTGALRSGNTRSCGCLHVATVTTHGHSRSSEYRIWLTMIQRCDNPRAAAYDRYGGRGIRVCERWLQSFENFLEDVGPRPSLEHSIDRIDNDGHYEPGNCRWATKLVQVRNQSRNRYLTFAGETLTISEWAQRYGLAPNVLGNRISGGWPAEKALTTPVHHPAKKRANARSAR
jgi:hypothetical protein